MQIDGATFLITGGSSGLGAGTARHLAARGARVVLADVAYDAAAALATEIGAHTRAIATDVTNEASMQAAIDLALKEFGALHGLVNCAGVVPPERVLGRDGPHKLDLFKRVIDINLTGIFNAIRLSAQAMEKNTPNADDERGVIVSTASISAFEGQIGQAAYSASKAGVAGMTLPIARELARAGIRVMAIAPGIFETPMLGGLSSEVQASLGAQVPFPPRFGRAAEFAALVEHIVINPMLNGEVIRLDGALRVAAK